MSPVEPIAILTIPERALRFALKARDGRMNNGRPYEEHLNAVVGNVQRFYGFDNDLICAAWLHDTLEDTPSAFDTIEKEYGYNVALLVNAVTLGVSDTLENQLGIMCDKIVSLPSTILGKAIALKLCEYLANIQEAHHVGDIARLKQYRTEWSTIRRRFALYSLSPSLVACVEAVFTQAGLSREPTSDDTELLHQIECLEKDKADLTSQLATANARADQAYKALREFVRLYEFAK